MCARFSFFLLFFPQSYEIAYLSSSPTVSVPLCKIFGVLLLHHSMILHGAVDPSIEVCELFYVVG